jgi:UDP-2-acetamido-3-amino-2,3-dideoxy-glucuronate N-acetyltransferase
MSRIHAQALVESEDIGDGTSIWAFAHVMKGVRIGRNANIGDHAFLESGAVLGNNVTIKNQVCIWEGVVIEDDVFVGPLVTFTNDRYPRSPRMPEVKERYSSRENWLCQTWVRRGCAIGAGAVICPGVELGAYSVVGAGAVVTRSVPPFTMVYGNPARIMRDVCSCGEPLAAAWNVANCSRCGETGSQRLLRMNPSDFPPGTIELSPRANEHG